MLFEENKMNSIEWQIYNKWFDEFSTFTQNMKFIYIRTHWQICLHFYVFSDVFLMDF